MHGEPPVTDSEYGKQVVLEGEDFTLGLVALIDGGGASWQSQSLAAMCDFILSVALLYWRCIFGQTLQATRDLVTRWYDLRCLGPVLL